MSRPSSSTSTIEILETDEGPIDAPAVKAAVEGDRNLDFNFREGRNGPTSTTGLLRLLNSIGSTLRPRLHAQARTIDAAETILRQ